MFVKQLYTSCLSEAAYYIESNGEAAIIDPLRDIDEYIELAKERKASIKYIFETHFHADFVSGHIDLSKATGAPIIFGPKAETDFKIYNAKDNEVFALGSVTITALHTPGHTLESTCYLLKDENGQPNSIFTGDTLFVGDVGRPDLSSGNMTSEELAAVLYNSLQEKILPLPEDVIVYPAHGPGSSCGKSLGAETFSTIAEQKATNYALQPQSQEEFVKAVTDGLQSAPVYFAINASINKKGYDSIDAVIANGMKALSVAAFKKLQSDSNTIVLDTRHANTFVDGFIPNSIFIGLEGRFAEWAGNLLPFDKNIILVTPPGQEKETVVRLSRVGFDKMQGYLKGGYEAWKKAGEAIDLIVEVEPDELMMDIPFDDNLLVVDVRKEAEYGDGHLPNAHNLPLSDMNDVVELANLEESQNLYVHCAGGYRSVIACSMLKKHGFNNIRNVQGGWAKIKELEKVKIVKEPSVLN